MIILNTCNDTSFAATMLFIKKLVDIIFIIAPVLLILLLTIDFTKAVIEGSEDKIKHIKEIAIKRVIFAIILFFVPLIVDTSFGLLSNSKSKIIKCYNEVTISKVNSLVEKVNKEEKKKEQAEEKFISANKKKQDAEATKREKNAKAARKKSQTGNNIYFLNTGSSDAIILESGGSYGMIDTALESSSNVIITQLKKLKVQKLDFVLITHSHADHTGGFSSVAKQYKIDKLYIKTTGVTKGVGTDVFQSLIKDAKNSGAQIVNFETTETFNLGNFTLVPYNQQFRYKSGLSGIQKARLENGDSAVVVATIGGKKIYFAGDIGNYYGINCETETANEIGKVDIYKVAHHGYVTFNNNYDAIKKLRPEYSVFTNFAGNGPAVQRITDKSVNPNHKKYYYTGNGTVKLEIKNDGSFKFNQ